MLRDPDADTGRTIYWLPEDFPLITSRSMLVAATAALTLGVGGSASAANLSSSYDFPSGALTASFFDGMPVSAALTAVGTGNAAFAAGQGYRANTSGVEDPTSSRWR